MLRQPPRGFDSELRSQLRYYSEAVHASAFVLPQFAEEVVSKVRRPAISQSLPLSSFHGATPRTPGALKNAALNNNNVLRAAMVCGTVAVIAIGMRKCGLTALFD